MKTSLKIHFAGLACVALVVIGCYAHLNWFWDGVMNSGLVFIGAYGSMIYLLYLVYLFEGWATSMYKKLRRSWWIWKATRKK